MAKVVNKLTDVKIRKAPPGRHPDGDGLYLQVRGPTAKAWIYRYWTAGKSREMGLGSYPSVTLEGARQERDRFKRQRQDGADPIKSRDAERVASLQLAGKALTFTEAAASFIRDKSQAWKNEKHRQQWTNTLNTYVNPILGNLPVGEIDTAAVKRVLDPIWATKSETATRVRGRIEAILDWCKALGYCTGENPARWRGNLKDLLASPFDLAAVEHHPALDYQELPAFMDKLRAQQNVASSALEWVILTASRANESLRAIPAEVSESAKVWTVPRLRMKGSRGRAKEHRVPLSARALEVLRSLPRDSENPYLFQGLRKGSHLSDGALRVLLIRMGVSEKATTHGFRATFRTWASEQTRFPREVVEKALAHVVGDETERAYDRGDLFEKRRKLMDAWATYCMSKPAQLKENVVAIRAAE